jgi:hypothetical protein
MEYANRRRVSLSTLRRQIKADKIQYRLEHGKYLVFDEASLDPLEVIQSIKKSGDHSGLLEAKLQALESAIRLKDEQLSELQMLVSLYEDQISRFKNHS